MKDEFGGIISDDAERDEFGGVLAKPTPQVTPQVAPQVKKPVAWGDFFRTLAKGAPVAMTGLNINPETEEERQNFLEGAKHIALAAPAVAARTIPPVAGYALGGPFAPALGAAGGAAGEAAAQGYEKLIGERENFSPAGIAGGTVAGALNFAAPVTRGPIRYLASHVLSGAVRGAGSAAAEEATKAATGEDKFRWENVRDRALLGAGLEGGLSGLGRVAQAVRSMRPSDNAVGEFAAQLYAPFEAQKIQDTADKIRRSVDVPEAKELIDRLAGPIAQYSRHAPEEVSNVIANAIRTSPDGEIGQQVKDALTQHLGNLGGAADQAVDQFAGDYVGNVGKMTASETGALAKELGQAEIEKHRQRFDELYKPYNESEAFNTPVDELSGAKPQTPSAKGNLATMTPTVAQAGEEQTAPTLNQLREQRTKALKAIKWGNQVQRADFDAFEHLDNIQGQIDDALEKLPESVREGYRNVNELYKQEISRFKGKYANVLLRNIGEAGGGESGVITGLLGPNGPTNLKALKAALGSSYDAARPAVGQQVFNQLAADGSSKLVQNLQAVATHKPTGLQPEIVREFFPNLDSQKLSEAASAVAANDSAFAKQIRDAVAAKGELHEVDPESLMRFLSKDDNGFNASQLKSVISPEMQENTRNYVLANLIEKSGGNPVRLRTLANDSMAFKKLFGEGSQKQIEGIAQALEAAAANKSSPLAKMLLMGTAAAGGGVKMATLTHSPWAIGSSMVGQAHIADKLQDRLRSYVSAKVLTNPRMRSLMTKPYEELTNAETRELEENLPKVTTGALRALQ